jgi:hypothetical protein
MAILLALPRLSKQICLVAASTSLRYFLRAFSTLSLVRRLVRGSSRFQIFRSMELGIRSSADCNATRRRLGAVRVAGVVNLRLVSLERFPIPVLVGLAQQREQYEMERFAQTTQPDDVATTIHRRGTGILSELYRPRLKGVGEE